MVYQWKVAGLTHVDAQTAGEELDRIHEKNGSIRPKDIVDESRSVTAPLHPCFEWDDSKAAERYRESQAGDILRNITVQIESPKRAAPLAVRAFVSVDRGYHPIIQVAQCGSTREILLQNAIRELNEFRKKYEDLAELSEVFAAAGRVTA